MTQGNPYRSQAKQYQQRQGQQRQPGKQFKEGFDPELLGQDVEAETVKGINVVIIKGKVIDVSKYWIKIDAEVIIHISNEKVNSVLKYGHKFDEDKAEEKDENINPLFKVGPKVLEPYYAWFLKQGWVPFLSSLDFVKFILEIVGKEQTVYNTTKDELRTILLNALKKFKFTTVSYKDGAPRTGQRGAGDSNWPASVLDLGGQGPEKDEGG